MKLGCEGTDTVPVRSPNRYWYRYQYRYSTWRAFTGKTWNIWPWIEEYIRKPWHGYIVKEYEKETW